MSKPIFIPWRKEYELGIETIDKQHQSLVAIINELYQAFIENHHHEKLADVIKELDEYTHKHFGTEEAFFEQFNYAEKESHKKEHDYFRKRIVDFKKEFNSGKRSLTFQVLNFLRDWLIKHIQGTDQKYKDLFLSKGL